MKSTAIIIFLLAVTVLVTALLKPNFLHSSDTLTASMVWASLGTFFSFMGFIFSVYAVFEVKNLSDRYYSKQRLPELKAQLEKIADRMTEMGKAELESIRKERFMGQIVSVTNRVGQMDLAGTGDVIGRILTLHDQLEQALKAQSKLKDVANTIDPYWLLLIAVTQLVDEIEQHKKEAEAMS